MQYSTLTEISTSRELTEEFLGYSHNARISDGQFFDMRNLSSDEYPVLSQRKQRGVYSYATSGTHTPRGIIAKDNLCYVDGTTLYINNSAVTGLALTASEKQLISMGAYIIIMPDKKYVNTLDLSDKGSIEASFSSTSGSTVSFELCQLDGSVFASTYTVSSQAPSDPSNMDYWIDTSSTPHSLKVYSSTSSVWTQVATTYVKIKYPNIAKDFNEYDGLYISGITVSGISDLNGNTSVCYGAYHDPGDETASRSEGTNDYLIFTGFFENGAGTATQTESISLSRNMPLMDFIIESENRLWGCRYGLNSGGEVVNEIYASKLGDFKNWNTFLGISTDSYAASLGTDGQFTGAIAFMGYPTFFKENCVHKVYGNYPSNYQIQTTAVRGVQKGAGKSLAIVGDTLYYKGRNGVCAYDGSLPTEVSSAFGNIRYSATDSSLADALRNGAVGGALKDKYYISMKSEEDNLYYFFVYDTNLGTWHLEDNTRADAFCECKGDLYYIDHDSAEIKSILGSGTQESDNIEWMAETGDLGLSYPDKKVISRILLRLVLPFGSNLRIYINYDSESSWKEVAYLIGNSLRSFAIPIKPKRCDHFKIKLLGSGVCKVYSIVKTLEQGSDI